MPLVPQEVFASAVPYYAGYRTGYPQDRVDQLARRVGLAGGDRVVDIGCGCGQMAAPLARHAASVIAIDPLEAMLDRGRARAEALGIRNITWLHGDSRQLLDLVAPGPLVAVFAASFHWTDRPRVADTLGQLLATNGSIVVVSEAVEDADQPDWVDAITEVQGRYLGAPGVESEAYLNPSLSHQEVLEDSPFSVVHTQSWDWRRELTVDQVVGLQFSYSVSTPARFGDNAARVRTGCTGRSSRAASDRRCHRRVP